MNILLLYPGYPDTYWSFKHALGFVSKKAAVPPLGLITVSAMLPNTWQKKLVDLNVSALESDALQWADYVFISAMYVQKESVNNILQECSKYPVKIVAGGPLFTQEYKNYPQIDYFILNEAEITLPPFLHALKSGLEPERIYQTGHYADLTTTPIPDYHLLNIEAYASMNIQVSRGCPFACDFCEITSLLGHKVRMKSTKQVLKELEKLYTLNWRGPVSIVDDNFIGNKKVTKYELLPAIIHWMEVHDYPFTFSIQTSIDISDNDETVALITRSGINSAFIGIETPDEKSLESCNKVQNRNRDLIQSVKKLQQAGLQVSGGFIVGFDSDSPSIFQKQIDFIQQSGIVSAMVGLLNAPKNTKLYKQLEDEKRLTVEASGSNTDFTMNFVPKMSIAELKEGYKKIIQNIYSVKPYYKRIRLFLLNYQKFPSNKKKLQLSHIKAFMKSVLIIGIKSRGRSEYWKLLIWTLFRKPELVVDAITFAVYGYHFRTVYGLEGSK